MKNAKPNSTTSKKGVVYLLTNSAMPGLVKIGKTTTAAKVRMDQLYSTGVPVPLECPIAVEVRDIDAVERALHIAFGPQRVNPKREFFKIDELQAVVLLEQFNKKNVTPQVTAGNDKIDDQSKQAGERLRARRPNLNFEEMEIPAGSTLTAVNSDNIAVVVDARSVDFNGETMSLTAATRKILDIDQSVQPTPHWQFEGELLKDIYERVYGEDS